MDEKDWKQKINWTWVLIGLPLTLAIALMASHVDVIVPVMGMAAVTAWICIPFWFAHKRKLAKEQMQLQRTNPEQEADMKRMKDRLENLEAVMCNLDREMNWQLERSLSSGALVTGTGAAGVSQMPTTFMNVAAALEGRYQILKELGRGGMGIVFQAQDKQLNEQVAIKILSPLLSNDAEALERMRREVSAARRITHPNVIRTYDLSEVNGLHFVSMEYFAGANLKEHLKQTGPLSLMEAFNIASQICEGLQAAHSQGIVHRDLKSQNIILNSTNQIKIIDFGLASIRQMQGMTATGMIMGTPEYMAPEQVAGKKVDERADIYSLGIILYELFTGRVPFTGDSAISVGFQQMKDDPVPPRQVNPQIPVEIEKVILKALQKDPLNRYRTVAELKVELEAAVHHPVPSRLREPSPAKSELEKVKH
jgi:serine/threonine-protein kinase